MAVILQGNVELIEYYRAIMNKIGTVPYHLALELV